MTDREIAGKYKRLREELSEAHSKPVLDTSHIERLAAELAAN